jgi:hypothetical protein
VRHSSYRDSIIETSIYTPIYTPFARFLHAAAAKVTVMDSTNSMCLKRSEGAMSENQSRPTYHIYLLTVWQAPVQTPGEASAWRFQMTDPHTGDRQGFTSAEELLAVLAQFGSPSPEAACP